MIADPLGLSEPSQEVTPRQNEPELLVILSRPLEEVVESVQTQRQQTVFCLLLPPLFDFHRKRGVQTITAETGEQCESGYLLVGMWVCCCIVLRNLLAVLAAAHVVPGYDSRNRILLSDGTFPVSVAYHNGGTELSLLTLHRHQL
jgi:hypothetical protein